MTSGNRCVRNRKIRTELKPILEKMPVGTEFKVNDLAHHFKDKTRDISGRTMGCLLREYSPELIVSDGEGVWRRV